MITEKMKKEIQKAVKDIIKEYNFDFDDVNIEVADYDAVCDLISVDEDDEDFDSKWDAAVREINEYGNALLKAAEKEYNKRMKELKKEFLKGL